MYKSTALIKEASGQIETIHNPFFWLPRKADRM